MLCGWREIKCTKNNWQIFAYRLTTYDRSIVQKFETVRLKFNHRITAFFFQESLNWLDFNSIVLWKHEWELDIFSASRHAEFSCLLTQLTCLHYDESSRWNMQINYNLCEILYNSLLCRSKVFIQHFSIAEQLKPTMKHFFHIFIQRLFSSLSVSRLILQVWSLSRTNGLPNNYPLSCWRYENAVWSDTSFRFRFRYFFRGHNTIRSWKQPERSQFIHQLRINELSNQSNKITRSKSWILRISVALYLVDYAVTYKASSCFYPNVYLNSWILDFYVFPLVKVHIWKTAHKFTIERERWKLPR